MSQPTDQTNPQDLSLISSQDPSTASPPTSSSGFSKVQPIGVGGYDLLATTDRGFAFDYQSDGNLNHIVFYRPGNGTIWIIDDNHHSFSPEFSEGDPGNGIAGYKLDSVDDRAFAYDFKSRKRLNHIVLYNAPAGRLWILERVNDSKQFNPVYRQDDSNGPNKINLRDGAQIFAFDYDGQGCLDHLAVYYPGKGIIEFYKPL